MKTNFLKIFLVLLLAIYAQISYAQCGKNLVFESSKTEYLDADGKVTRSQDKPVDLNVADSVLTVQFGDNQDQVLTGKITGATCTGKTPFKDGIMVLKAVLKNPAGIQQTATLTFISTKGNTTLLYTCQERAALRIQLSADKFEEVKP